MTPRECATRYKILCRDMLSIERQLCRLLAHPDVTAEHREFIALRIAECEREIARVEKAIRTYLVKHRAEHLMYL